MTGTALSLITENNKDSYNVAVNTINRHQKENIKKLQNVILNIQRPRLTLYTNILQLKVSLQSLQNQVFLNQVLIDNWNKSQPYTYDYTILED